MPSRVLIGAAAWLLGAASATTGSLYAVNQLGNGILWQPSQQLSVADVKIDLGQEPAISGRTGTQLAGRAVPGHGTTSARPHGRPSLSAGRYLYSAAGTVLAVCEAGQAYLVSWSPQQGYADDSAQRGPAPVASVTFRGQGSGTVMQVTCANGTPTVRLVPFSNWSGGDE